MIKTITKATLILALSLLGGNALMAQGQVRINGHIPSMQEGEVLLVAQRVNGLDTLGRAPLASNRFKFDLNLDEAKVAWLQLAGYEGGFMAFIEPGQVYEAVLKQDDFQSIRGGKLQETYLRYQQLVQQHNQEIQEIRKELEAATSARHFKTASAVNKKLEAAREMASRETDSLININRGTVFAAYLLTSAIQKEDLQTMELNYSKLNEEEKNTQVGNIYASYIKGLKALNVGAKAPNFTLVDPDGKLHSLYGTAAKIKIIDFWASWCGPCRLENPNMIKLYEEFKKEGLEVIGVSLDDNAAKWVKAIKDDNINWLHLIAEAGWKSTIVQQYNIDGVPTIYVLDSDNKIIAKNLRGEKLHSFVQAYLSAK